jgi:hypothetical protein
MLMLSFFSLARARLKKSNKRRALLAFDRFTKERLGGFDIASGAQPEVDRPTRPVNSTIR